MTPQPVKVLCSFHFFRDAKLAPLFPPGAMVMGDSGAFSAHSTGAPVTYRDYTRWLTTWKYLLFSYPALDVIGDPDATFASQQRMEADGYRPLPVYHYGTPLRYLHRYLDAGHRYIALGGMVGRYGQDTKQWIIRCFQAAQPYGAVFHGFGRTRLDDLRDFPWYSVDSSNVARASRFGLVDLFDGHRFITLKRSEPRSLYRHGALLRAHGIAPGDMDNRNKATRALAYQVGVTGWRRCEEWLRARHGPVPGPRPGDPPGPHLFLADNPTSNIRHIVRTITAHPGPYLTPHPPTQEGSA